MHEFYIGRCRGASQHIVTCRFVVSVSVRLSSNAGMAAESWQVRRFALLRSESILNP